MKQKPKTILIIGESCLDQFVYCESQRLAPDVPIPVLQVVKKTENPGMAKNVERNIKALYPYCDIVTNENWRKVTKTRYMHEKTNHAFIRIDHNDSLKRIDVKKVPFKKYDIIAISDYNKGFLSEEDIAYICKHHSKVFIDTKKPVGNFLRDVLYIKINNFEYERSLPISKNIKDKIIVTKNGDPVEHKNKQYPVEKIEVKDSSGAGDSFFAALLVRYAETEDIDGAIGFAADRATQVVKQKGVTVIKKLNHEKSISR